MQKKIDRPDLHVWGMAQVCDAVYKGKTTEKCASCNHRPKTERQIEGRRVRHKLLNAEPKTQDEVRRCPRYIREAV